MTTRPSRAAGGPAKRFLGRVDLSRAQAVLGHLEAVEDLLKHGHTPTRTVYLAFGHDEEVGGEDGARAIAAELESRGVTLEFLLDEGANLGEFIRASRRIHSCISASSSSRQAVRP